MIGIVICYFGYQGYHFYVYNPRTSVSDYEELKHNFKIGNSVVVHHVSLNENEYRSFQEIKIKDIVSGFVIQDQSFTKETYVLYNDKNKVEKSISMSVGDSYVKRIEANQLGEDKYFKALHKKEILKKYNIKTDMELWDQVQEMKEKTSTIFTSVTDMKEQYFFQYLLVELPVIEKVIPIRGDLNGYIFYCSDRMKEIDILDGDKRYSFLFIGDYQMQEIEEFLNTIVI